MKRFNDRQRKVTKIHLLILTGYILVCLLYYFFHHDLREIVEYYSNKNIADSFSASMVHTLFIFIFGLLISYITVLSTLNDPRDEPFDSRVRALVNSDKVELDEQLCDYLKDHIPKSLAYNRTAKLTIEIKDFDKHKNAYHFYLESRQMISNLRRDEEFYNELVEGSVDTDIDEAGFEGIVHFLGLVNLNGEVIKSFDRSVKFNKSYKKEDEIRISKNDEIIWLFQYSIWTTTGEISDLAKWFQFSFSRYTRSLHIEIQNSMTNGRDLAVDLRYTEVVKKQDVEAGREGAADKFLYLCTNQLVVNRSVPVSPDTRSIDVYPEDRIDFFIHALED